MKIGLGISVVEDFILNAAGGGGGGPSSPADLATLSGYWRSDTDVYSDVPGTIPSVDLGVVRNVGDQSSAGVDLTTAGSNWTWFENGFPAGVATEPVVNYGSAHSLDEYNISAANEFCCGATVTTSGTTNFGTIMGRTQGSMSTSWVLWMIDGVWEFVMLNAWPTTGIRVRSTTLLPAPNSATNIMVDYDGSKLAAGVRMWIDGVQETLTVFSDNLGVLDIQGAAPRFGFGNAGGFGVATTRPSEGFIAAELLDQSIVDAFYAQSQIDYDY